MKSYIIEDKEEYCILAIIKADSYSQARAEAFNHWGKTFGMEFIEFMSSITCRRFKGVDIYDFDYVDGREIEIKDPIEEDLWSNDEIVNYFQENYKKVIDNGK